MAAPVVGERLAHFRIVAKLGEGGMGIVYRAKDDKLGRSVALKVLSDDFAQDDERRGRFLREARAAASLSHANIATVYEVGELEGRVFIAMELVNGESLRARLRRGPLSLSEVRGVARDVARGLSKAHESGIVHRDLKPDNVMVGTDGEVKLLDFGLAKVRVPADAGSSRSVFDRQEPITASGVEGRIVGSPPYMSPEQANGKDVDHRTDIFSFGVLVYELLTGRRPFVGSTAMETLMAISRDQPAPLASLVPGVGAELQQIVDRCLAKDREKRYATVRDLLAAIDRLALPSADSPPAARAAARGAPSKPEYSRQEVPPTPAVAFTAPRASGPTFNVKAQGMLNGAKSIEEEYGRDALRDVLHACSAATRERYTSANLIDWHPVDELVDFLSAAERVLGGGRAPGKIAEGIGAAGARASTKGALLRLGLYVGRPEFLMKRAASIWRQYNDAGAMDLLHMDERTIRVQVRDLPRSHALFCATLTGWHREISMAFGLKNIIARHPECIAGGGPRCIWEVRALVPGAPLGTG